MKFDTICVVGLGYIGLPTAAMFAARRKMVIGVDIKQEAVDTINRGEIHIVEPDLDIVVRAAVREGTLRATTRPEPADAFLVAVPTPFKRIEDENAIPTPDLSYVQAAADAIAPVLKKGDQVILESTSPVGATEQMADWLAAARPDLSFPQHAGEESDIRVSHCPERVLPGKVMKELIENDRIIGGMTQKCAQAACDLYKTFVTGKCLVTSARTAEMTKLTENAFRDVNIAFANELSIICEKMEINVWELISLANHHPRVNILQPGPGVGGHCIAVDPWFIISGTPNEAEIIKTARRINDKKPKWVIERVLRECEKYEFANGYKPTVGFYGISFKPDIDDLRGSPALSIVEYFSEVEGFKISVIEPNIKSVPPALCGKVDFRNRVERGRFFDINVILVNHKEFNALNINGVVIDVTGSLWKL